jgi:hypothetical protein
LAGALALAWVAGPAIAGIVLHDTHKPPWRYGPRTVSAEWDFLDDDNPADPERWEWVGDNEGSSLHDPNLHRARIQLHDDFDWEPGQFGQGMWRNKSGSELTISFDITNWVYDGASKRLRIQVTYEGARPETFRVYGWVGNDQHWGQKDPAQHEWDGYYFEDWTFPDVNPHYEEIILIVPPQTAINQVVIDTQCVPGPGAAAAWGAGFLLLAARRRRA